jgi:pyridoxal phosphate enzyme (YggS family)
VPSIFFRLLGDSKYDMVRQDTSNTRPTTIKRFRSNRITRLYRHEIRDGLLLQGSLKTKKLIQAENFAKIQEEIAPKNATLVAVSKTKPPAAIQELYTLGQRDFGENYVQELVEKQPLLPPDIRWHFIGHLQSNKVKYIAPFVHLIHGIDSLKLLKEVNKQAQKLDRVIPVLLQVHIAREETKFGLDAIELQQLLEADELAEMKHVTVKGLMGMASFSDDEEQVKAEFLELKSLFDKYKHLSIPNCKFDVLSMGMSGDYQLALEQGSNMVRIGSLLFGTR